MSVATLEPLSQQFDATRDEIIANFRERIQQKARFKLKKIELEELIELFITRLQSLDDSESIKQLCEAEIALLEEGYKPPSVGKNYLPKYRKAIALAIEEQRLELNNHNSHSYTYFKDGAEHLTTEHWALTYLKYDRASYEQFAQSTIRNNNLKQDSLQPVNLSLYLEQVSSLLESDDPLELAIALAAVTGRRYSEVMARGHFEPTDHPYQVHFSGQLKKRGAVDSYTTFTLVPTTQVLAAFDKFRNHPTISNLQDASIEEINKLNTPINRSCKQYFQDTGLVPVLVGEAGVTIQNLRGIYGEIAVHLFCPPSMGVHRFIQQRLGHLIADPELAHGKNSGSTEHYFHYYLIDRSGQQLADKGILLQSTSLVLPAQDREIEQLELPTQSETIGDTSTAESVSTSEVDREPEITTTTTTSSSSSSSSVQPEPDLDSGDFIAHITTLINRDDYQHLLVGLMAATGLDAASLLKLLVFKNAAAPHLILYCQQLHPSHQPKKQLLTLLPAPDVLEALWSLRRHRDAIDFAHTRTATEINAEVAKFTPTVLESVGLTPNLNLQHHYFQLLPLLFQHNFTRDAGEPSTFSLSTQTQQKLAHWQQHFSAADVDDTLAQLMDLASEAKKSPTPTPSATTEQSRPQPLSSPSTDSEPNPWLAISRLTETVAHLTNQVLAQNDRLLNLQFSPAPHPNFNPQSQTVPKPQTKPISDSTPPSTGSKPAPNLDALKSLTSAQLRHTRSPGAPTEKLHRALEAVIQYNLLQSDPKHMWRINPRLLQQLTGCFNDSVKQFIQQHQSEIEQHNQQFNLTSVRHNAVHKGQDPNQFIQW